MKNQLGVGQAITLYHAINLGEILLRTVSQVCEKFVRTLQELDKKQLRTCLKFQEKFIEI